jgi:hypothetical protein
MAAVGEGVLGIELQLVDLEAGEDVDQAAQGRKRRDLVAADVEEHAAVLEVRPVADLETRHQEAGRARTRRPMQTQPLSQGRGTTEEAGGGGRGDDDALAPDREPVALRRRTYPWLDRQQDVGVRTLRPPGTKTQRLEISENCRERRRPAGIRRAGIHRDPWPPAEQETAFGAAHLVGPRPQQRGGFGVGRAAGVVHRSLAV